MSIAQRRSNERIGFHADHDQSPFPGLRFVQMTPPGSHCSIAFGTNLGITLEPGRQDTIQVVVPDADRAVTQLRAAGVEASDVDEQPWGRFARFHDPDGNTWTLQQLPSWAPNAEA